MQLVPEPNRQRTGLQPDAIKTRGVSRQEGKNRLGTGRYLPLGNNAADIVNDTNRRGFLRYIECSKGGHEAFPSIAERTDCNAVSLGNYRPQSEG